MEPPTVNARLELAVDHSLVRLVRLVVSGVASTLAMEIDDVESCRSAADELCSILVDLGDPSGTLAVQIAAVDGSLVVSGQVERDTGRAIDDDRRRLAQLIVDATADEHELVTEPPTVSFRFVKRRRRGAPDEVRATNA